MCSDVNKSIDVGFKTSNLPLIDLARLKGSLADDLDEHPLIPLAVELVVEDLLPGSEVEAAAGDGDHALPAHDLPLHVGVGVVLPAVVPVLGVRLLRGELLQPYLPVVVQSTLIIVDEDAGGDVHRIDEDQPLLNPALDHSPLHLRGDVDDLSPAFGVEDQLRSVTLHGFLLSSAYGGQAGMVKGGGDNTPTFALNH